MRREIPADIVCQDELVTAFHYVPSQEPTHIIIAPNKPVAIIADVTDADEAVLVRMIRAATRLAEQAGVERQDTGSSLTVGPTSARKFFTSTCTWSVVAHSEGCCRIPEGCYGSLPQRPIPLRIALHGRPDHTIFLAFVFRPGTVASRIPCCSTGGGPWCSFNRPLGTRNGNSRNRHRCR